MIWDIYKKWFTVQVKIRMNLGTTRLDQIDLRNLLFVMYALHFTLNIKYKNEIGENSGLYGHLLTTVGKLMLEFVHNCFQAKFSSFSSLVGRPTV